MAAGKLIPLGAGDATENMAIDQTLLESVDDSGVPALRFYTWREPTLSLGYFQRVSDRRLHPESRKAVCVRRATGGGAILHDHELTYSIVMPIRSSETGKRLRLYEQVHQAIVEVLATFGVRSGAFKHVGGRLDDEKSFLCFQRRTDEDLVVAGYKVLGSAQRRSRHAVLQHGSLLIRSSQLAPQLPGLSDLTAIEVDRSALVQRLVDRFSDTLGVRWKETEITDAELTRVREIVADRFGARQWLNRR